MPISFPSPFLFASSSSSYSTQVQIKWLMPTGVLCPIRLREWPVKSQLPMLTWQWGTCTGHGVAGVCSVAGGSEVACPKASGHRRRLQVGPRTTTLSVAILVILCVVAQPRDGIEYQHVKYTLVVLKQRVLLRWDDGMERAYLGSSKVVDIWGAGRDHIFVRWSIVICKYLHKPGVISLKPICTRNRKSLKIAISACRRRSNQGNRPSWNFSNF